MKAILTCFVLTVISITARSDTVWSWTMTLESHSAGNNTQEMVWFENDLPWLKNYGIAYNLFNTMSFNAADVGHTFTISSPTDDGGDFLAAVSSLTDGRDGQITITEGTANMGGWTFWESGLFANVPRTGPDLIGYRIDSINITIDQLWIGRDFHVNPDPRQAWTDTYGSATLSIEGAVIPEPTTVAIGGIGLVVLGVLQGMRTANQTLHRMRLRRIGELGR